MSEEKQIHLLMPQVMFSIGAIAKEQENTSKNYNFRSVDDVLNHLNPALVKHEVSVAVSVHDHKLTRLDTEPGKFQIQCSLRLTLTFFAPDGSSRENSAVGEAMDYNGDKATAKAMSMAFKYACFLGLVIPVDGVLDESDAPGGNEPVVLVNPEQVEELKKLMAETGTKEDIFLNWAQVHSLSDMTLPQYEAAKKKFAKKKEATKQPENQKPKITEIA